MNKKGSTGVLIILALVAVLLVWGFVGAAAANDAGVTCDVGVGDILCWKWHTNVAGQAEEFANDLFG